MCNSECVPAVFKQKKRGQYCDASHGKRIARDELIKRDGPPPFPKAVCRHLCENDSTAPNGFVCTLHTVWGTQKENMDDRSEEVKRAFASAGAKAGASPAGKKSCSIERTCPYCCRTIKGNGYFSHERKCKLAPPPSVVASE